MGVRGCRPPTASAPPSVSELSCMPGISICVDPVSDVSGPMAVHPVMAGARLHCCDAQLLSVRRFTSSMLDDSPTLRLRRLDAAAGELTLLVRERRITTLFQPIVDP